MNKEEKLAWQGCAHFYNELSGFYLYQDLYGLSSLMHSIIDTQYKEYAKKIIEYIHLDDHKLITEGEVKQIKDELSFFERDYQMVDTHQMLEGYKKYGYELEGFEPDHLGIELKFMAILAIDTSESENFIELIPREIRFLNAHLGWLDSLIEKLQTDKKDPRLTKEVVLLTKEYIKNHKAFLESYLH